MVPSASTSHFGHQWAENHPYRWATYSLGFPPVTYSCHCTSCGPTAFTVWKFIAALNEEGTRLFFSCEGEGLGWVGWGWLTSIDCGDGGVGWGHSPQMGLRDDLLSFFQRRVCLHENLITHLNGWEHSLAYEGSITSICGGNSPPVYFMSGVVCWSRQASVFVHLNVALVNATPLCDIYFIRICVRNHFLQNK